MYLDKLIKREFLVLLVSVITVTIIIFAVFYIRNSKIDINSNNIISLDNLEIKYCEDILCKKTYSNFGNVIGTNNINGISNVNIIKKYENDTDAIKEKPYIINIKNTSDLDTVLTINITEDNDYKPYDNIDNLRKITDLYNNNLKIGITNCNKKEEVNVKLYNELESNILLDEDIIKAKKSNTYCIWTWINNSEEDLDNSYFVAKLDYKNKLIK